MGAWGWGVLRVGRSRIPPFFSSPPRAAALSLAFFRLARSFSSFSSSRRAARLGRCVGAPLAPTGTNVPSAATPMSPDMAAAGVPQSEPLGVGAAAANELGGGVGG